MHQLNSILIEGRVTAVFSKKGSPAFSIRIHNDRFEACDKDGKSRSVPINLSALGSRARTELSVGRIVRIVGRLTVRPYGGLVVEAEHLELKPEAARAA
jgi:hypothetical protein